MGAITTKPKNMRTLCLLTLLVLANLSFAQNYKPEFDQYFNKGDTLKQQEILTKWEKMDPTNAELYTSYFNYYFSKSRKDVLSLTTQEPNGESMSLLDSTGKTAGYLGSKIIYDEKIFKQAIDKIDKGIQLYPNRLDMRYGKIYVLGEVGDWKTYTDEIVKAIQYSTKNDNNWTWTYNEKKENGKDFFFSGLQNYQLRLYNTGNDNLLENMRTIATEILKVQPDHVESLSNISITYLLTKRYDEAIEVLLKAEKVAPKDAIILGNLAQGYKLKGDKKKAIEYYEKVIKYADKEMIEYGKQQIKELENSH